MTCYIMAVKLVSQSAFSHRHRASSRSGDRSGNKSPFEGSCCGSSYNSSEQENHDKTSYRVSVCSHSHYLRAEVMRVVHSGLDMH